MRNSTPHILSLCLLWMLALSACEEKRDYKPVTGVVPDSLQTGVFICNEGNFQWGNASLSFYNPQTGSVTEDLYKLVNKENLGDVLQSIYVSNDRIYLIVNNSGKIVVLDPKTFQKTTTINGLNSPRYMINTGSGKAYVSDLYENALWIINLSNHSIAGKISMKGWTEEMEVLNGKVYVCARNTPYVYVVDATQDIVTDSIDVGFGPQHICKDHNNRLWVLTTGKDPVVPQLHCIAPNGSIQKSISFGMQDKPTRLVVNKTGTNVYWINKDIYRFSTDDLTGSPALLAQAGGHNFYGLGYSNSVNEVLASDAKDYVQKSEILRFDTLGNSKGSFRAGINSGFFYNK